MKTISEYVQIVWVFAVHLFFSQRKQTRKMMIKMWLVLEGTGNW